MPDFLIQQSTIFEQILFAATYNYLKRKIIAVSTSSAALNYFKFLCSQLYIALRSLYVAFLNPYYNLGKTQKNACCC